MRAIFQRTSQVSYLFTGSLEHVMRDLFAPQRRALAGFGSFHALHPIAVEDWSKGIRARFVADGCEIEPRALERMVLLGELHPRVTMLIAQKTHFLSVLLDRRKIDVSLAEQGYDAAYQGDSALIDQLLENIRSSHRFALKLARRVAAGRRLTEGMHRGEAERGLKKLIDAGKPTPQAPAARAAGVSPDSAPRRGPHDHRPDDRRRLGQPGVFDVAHVESRAGDRVEGRAVAVTAVTAAHP